MTRVRRTRNPGTPELDRSDLAGTAFLLQAAGKDPAYAPRVHKAKRIDRARAAALTGRLSWLPDREIEGALHDPRASRPAAALEARDVIAALLPRLTDLDRKILGGLVDGLSLRDMGQRYGLSKSTVRRLVVGIRQQALRLLGEPCTNPGRLNCL